LSTVASESAFRTGGRVLDPFRSSLSPLTVETLIYCQNWLKNTSSPVKFREVMDEVQSFDEELELDNLFILYLYVQFFIIFFLLVYLFPNISFFPRIT
jgi:hypothetical protein